MTREEIVSEIEHIGAEIEKLKQQLLIADGAMQAFQYMLKLHDTPKAEEKVDG